MGGARTGGARSVVAQYGKPDREWCSGSGGDASAYARDPRKGRGRVHPRGRDQRPWRTAQASRQTQAQTTHARIRGIRLLRGAAGPLMGPSWEFAKRTQLLQCKSAHDVLNPSGWRKAEGGSRSSAGAHRGGRSIVLHAENDRVERTGGEASLTSLGTPFEDDIPDV